MSKQVFKYTDADQISYCIKGSGCRQIIFLHGFAASSHSWLDLAVLFPADEYTLHLLDLAGHGSSSKPAGADFSPLRQSRIVAEYIRSQGLDAVAIVGHSLGGAITLLTAMDCKAVTAIVLIGAPAFKQKIPHFMQLLGLPFLGPLSMALLPSRMVAKAGLKAAFHRQDRITERHIDGYAPLY